MKKIIYTLILLSLYQAVHAPEEIVNDPTVTTHRSTEDNSFENLRRRAKNTLGSFIGKHVSAKFGFGDLHETNQLLAKPARTTEESAQLTASFMKLDAHEKTEAIAHARTHRPTETTDQISSDIFDQLNNKDLLIKNSDGSIVVHDLATFKKPLTPAQRQIAVDTIKQYLKDPTNPQLLSSAKKIFEQTEIVSKLTTQEKEALAPNFFELSKLSENPQALQKTLLEPIKYSKDVKALVTKAVEQFVDNSDATPEQAQQLLSMYKDTNITEFFTDYFQYANEPQIERIQTLIGPDNVIVECNLTNPNGGRLTRMILNKNTPIFSSPEQAINVARFLCDPKKINDNIDTIRTILKKSMSPATRAEFMKEFSDKQLDTLLTAIKKPNEIIINQQLINIDDPAASITTQSSDDLADTVITALANKTNLSADEETALTNFVTDRYRKNPAQLARIIDKLSSAKAEAILGKLSPDIMLIKTADAPVLLDTQSLKLTDSTTKQADNILKTLKQEASPESLQAVQRAIAQHFQKELNITDTKSAQDVCNNLIAKQTPFEPEILRAIFDEMKLPEDQQQEFFETQSKALARKISTLQSTINNAPTEYHEGYGMAGGEHVPVGVDDEQQELNYLEQIDTGFTALQSAS